MKANGYKTIFIVVLLNFQVLGVVSNDADVDELNEGLKPYYEYIQIYKSIPAILEYLLNALQERPEILEINDVTLFKRTLGDIETDEYDSEKKTDQRDAECNDTKAQDDYGNDNYVNKRDTTDPKKVPETTIAYEYGNSNIAKKGLDEIESNKEISKRFANNEILINNFNNKRMKREPLNRENKLGRKKRNVLFKLDDDTNDMFQKYGDMFFGFEHLFGLDLKPEEIEERILIAEKLLEDFNDQKNK